MVSCFKDGVSNICNDLKGSRITTSYVNEDLLSQRKQINKKFVQIYSKLQLDHHLEKSILSYCKKKPYEAYH